MVSKEMDYVGIILHFRRMYFKWVGLQSQVVISWSSWPPFKCKEPLFCSLIEALRTPTHFLYPEPVMRTVTIRLSADLLGKKKCTKGFCWSRVKFTSHNYSFMANFPPFHLNCHASLHHQRGWERAREWVCGWVVCPLYSPHSAQQELTCV